MSTKDNELQSSDVGPVSERNIRRLVSKAYRPEQADAEFISRARAAFLTAGAQRQAQAQAVTPQAQAPLAAPVPDHATAARPGRPPRAAAPRPLNRRLGWLAAAAALLIAALIGLKFQPEDRPTQQFVRKGEVIWIDGKAYRLSPGEGSSQVTQVEPTDADLREPSARRFGLAPRTPQPPAELAKLALGSTLETGHGQRRCVRLPDGSLLFLNSQTLVEYSAERTLVLRRGEVFVEVSPRKKDTPGATFTVNTPDRKVTALGTKFRVKVAEKRGTDVLVTQGKVQVDDVLVYSGQQLHPDHVLRTAKRSTHVLDWTRELVNAANSPLVPESKHDGGALVCVDPSGQETRLTLRRYHVDVHIENGFARTTIDQTYFNHENRRLEGTFYFPLPPDASLSRLAMYVDGTLMEGGMAERSHARRVFEQIVSRQKDPALLEWVDGSTFKMRVFPLEAREEKRLLISYTQQLPELYGRSTYRFPGGHNLGSIRDWSLRVNLHDPSSWTCRSHRLSSKRVGETTQLRAKASQIEPDKDVVIELQSTSANASKSARVAQVAHDGQRYLMLRYRPDLPQHGKRSRRDWIFLVESSADRDPMLARTQIEVLRAMLGDAEHTDTFQLLTAGTRLHAMTPQRLSATPKNIKRAIDFLERMHLIGALDLGRAFSAAADLSRQGGKPKGYRPYVVHIGSGVPTLGQRHNHALVKAFDPSLRYVGIGVGKRWNRSLMKQLASKSGGMYTQVNPDEPIAWRSREVIATLDTPRLLDVRVVDGDESLRWHIDRDALADGESLLATARLPKGATPPSKLIISGSLDGKTISRVVQISQYEAAGNYLPRTWAKMEIEALLAEDQQKHKARIIDLSKQMYVMSPFTSLLVLENEEMYQRFKVDRGRKDHWALYPAPDKVSIVFEPDPNNPIAQRTRGRKIDPTQSVSAKSTADQLLSSLLIRGEAQFTRWEMEAYSSTSSTLSALQLKRHILGLPLPGNSGWWSRRRLDSRGVERLREWTLPDESVSAAQAGGENEVSLRQAIRAISLQQIASLDKRARRFDGGRRLTDAVERITLENRALFRLESVLNRRMDFQGFFRVNASRVADATFLLLERANRRRVAGAYRRAWQVRDGLDTDALLTRLTVNPAMTMQYRRPVHTGDWRLFADLIRFAPGMNSSVADIRDTMARESTQPTSRQGRVSEESRKLIQTARRSAWRELQREDGDIRTRVVFDGTGRYRIDRVYGHGLREIVICDGETVRHLYPELGIGAERSASPHQYDEFLAVAPMALPAVKSLARGHDLELADARTITLRPHPAKGGQPTGLTSQLVFDDQGALAERRMFDAKGKLQHREVYGGKLIRYFDAKGALVRSIPVTLKRSKAAELQVKTRDLVILPLPYRSATHATKTLFASGKAPKDCRTWTEKQALGMIASAVGQRNASEAQRIIFARYLKKQDHRVGWYSLLLGSDCSWNPAHATLVKHLPVEQPWLDAQSIAPRSTVARYLMAQLRAMHQPKTTCERIEGKGLIAGLDQLWQLTRSYQQGVAKGAKGQQQRLFERTLDYVKHAKDVNRVWSVLSLILAHAQLEDPRVVQILETMLERFGERSAKLKFITRYELARIGWKQPETKASAYAMFLAAHEEAMKLGLPRVDGRFFAALEDPPAGGQPMARVLQAKVGRLLASKRGAAAVQLAWQCWIHADRTLAQRLLDRVLAQPKLALETAAIALEMLWHTQQRPAASALVARVLADPAHANSPGLWQIAARMAGDQRQLARAIEYQEQAIACEMADLPERLNLQIIRREFSQLLRRYARLAEASQSLGQQPPSDLISRVVKAADQWRAFDTDSTQAATQAAAVLHQLGARALAWDYLTTPLAHKPNEAEPWSTLANALSRQGELDKAISALRTAFEIDGSNPNLLWQRAELHQRLGQRKEAHAAYSKIIEGEWGRRFSWLKTRAHQQLER